MIIGNKPCVPRTSITSAAFATNSTSGGLGLSGPTTESVAASCATSLDHYICMSSGPGYLVLFRLDRPKLRKQAIHRTSA